MKNNRQALIQFVLDQALSQPVSNRIEIYRALAEMVGDQKESNKLLSMANDLETFEREHARFTFDFSQTQPAKKLSIS